MRNSSLGRTGALERTMPDLHAFIQLLRPQQWLKNLMLYFPPFLGGALLQSGAAVRGILPFIAFSMVSSATYIVNDVFDCRNDRHHPEKRARPLPSGRISIPAALMLAACLASAGIGLAYWAYSLTFLTIICLYLGISLAYSLRLKEIPLVDIFCISAGFLLRLEAGGAVFGIDVSEWLFLSVFLLSVFLSTGKRISEKQRLGDEAALHRKALDGYPAGFLDAVMQITGGAVLVTYTMYAISRHSSLLVYTVPLCCFGLFRYLLRIRRGEGGDPTESLTRDVPLFLVGLAWAIMVGWGIYGQ
jgi:decaprenyl-phosphate phosphoribosyltransferase